MWTAFSFDSYNLLLCGLVTIAMQLSFFAIAATFKFDLVTDFAGGTNFILLAILTLVLRDDYNAVRPIVGTVLVVAWGIRIAGFLLFRILKLGKQTK
jgi:steroid 5-alpha reductase family enzyme